LSLGKPETSFRGNCVSPGVAVGRALKLDSHNRFILKTPVADADLEAEVQRFRLALQLSREQLENLKIRLEEKVGKDHSVILDAHLLMLEDPSLLAAIEGIVRDSHANAEWAVREAADRVRFAYEALEDEYFRERGRDIEYVAERLLANLSGDKLFSWDALPDDTIILAHDLSPSSFASMDLRKVRGVALESGGRNSHTAILARSLRIPAIMEIRDFLHSVKTGDPALLNADEGVLTLWPSEARRDAVSLRLAGSCNDELLSSSASTSTATVDGVAVSLRANAELPHEAAIARKCGAEGIGLFRSEFVFFAHPHAPPGIEEQFEIYSMLAREMRPYAVSVRTLDAGIDRRGARVDPASEPNPSMGLRGIRLSLVSRKLFAAQVEAILRASQAGPIEIVIPMVSSLEEIREARAVISRVQSRLETAMVPGDLHVPVGVMIEVPAAVLTLELIAREVDFLCVGTNDLVQYLLAVDRDNPQVAHLFQPLHPSVLQCLQRIADVAAEQEKPARICGEVSSNPLLAVLLIGMGFRQLSMNPFAIPLIRKTIGRVRLGDAEKLARTALQITTARETAEYLIRCVPSLVGLELGEYAAELRSPLTPWEREPGP